MATLVQSFKGGAGAATSTNISIGNAAGNGTVDTTSGNFLVAFVASSTSGRTTGASDNVNGTYNVDIGAANACGIFTFPNCAGGAITLTGTVSGAATSILIGFQEWSGILAVTPKDQVISGTSGSTTSFTSSTTGTLAQASELVLTSCQSRTNVTNMAVSGPYTPDAQSPVNISGNELGFGYQIVSSTAGVNATFTWTTNAISAIAVATYKLAAAGAQTPPFYSRKYILFNT